MSRARTEASPYFKPAAVANVTLDKGTRHSEEEFKAF